MTWLAAMNAGARLLMDFAAAEDRARSTVRDGQPGAGVEEGAVNVTDFLLARLAEDEATAREASVGRVWTWAEGNAELFSDHLREYGPECIIDAEGANPPGPKAGAHIARHDPARVLRQVEAMRRVVEEHRPTRRQVIDGDGMETVESYFLCDSEMDMWPCDTLLALAVIWSDHPDYDPAWRI